MSDDEDIVKDIIEERETYKKPSGLNLSSINLPDQIKDRAMQIYSVMMENPNFKRINKLSKISFVCVYYASHELGYFCTPEDIAERVGLSSNVKKMNILKQFSHINTNHRRKRIKVCPVFIVREYASKLYLSETDIRTIKTIWDIVEEKQPGIGINKNPIIIAAALIAYYLQNNGDERVLKLYEVLNTTKTKIFKYIKAIKNIHNS